MAFCLVIMALSGIIIFVLAPVEDENKPFDATEIIVYRKRSRISLCILTAMSVIFLLADNTPIASCIIVSVMVVSVMLVLGKIKNLRRN